jgi:hypothetical protein
VSRRDETGGAGDRKVLQRCPFTVLVVPILPHVRCVKRSARTPR